MKGVQFLFEMFLKAGISINSATQKKTQALMNTLQPGFNKAHLEIHEKLSTNVVGIQTRDLQTYFDSAVARTTFGSSHFDGNGDINYLRSIMRCRFQVPGSLNAVNWREWSWTGKNEVKVNQQGNTIKFECWTSIGKIYDGNYLLVFHPTLGPNPTSCGALQKCYSIEASKLPGNSKDQCQLRSFVKTGVPLPWQSHITWHPNSGGSPRVVVTLAIPGGGSQGQTFTWKVLQGPKPFSQLLDEKFIFPKAGIFSIEMKAIDVFREVETCHTHIRISDDVIPTSSSCPAARITNLRYNSDIAVNDANQLISGLGLFKTNAVYGQCQKGAIKTTELYQGWCLNKGAVCLNVGSSNGVNLKIRPDDLNHLKEISKTITLTVPGNHKPKCLRVHSQLREDTTALTCTSSPIKTLTGSTCDSKRCYDLHGSDLYKAGISINSATQKKTQALMNTLQPGFNKAHLEIHEKLSTNVVGIQTRDLQTYFDSAVARTTFGSSHFDGNGDINYLRSIMRCRFQVYQTPSWREWSWTGKNEVKLIQEINTIKFECWTSIGKIYDGNYRFILHPNGGGPINCSPDPIPNTCATSRPIFDSKRVELYVVLFRFCDLSPAIQNSYKSTAAKAKLRETLKRFGEHLHQQLDWDVKVTVHSHFQCAAPFDNELVVGYSGNGNSAESRLQINIVYKPIATGSYSITYAKWAEDAKNDIRAATKSSKAVSMMTFVMHQTKEHHHASTSDLYLSIYDEAILPNKHYHMEVVEDVNHNSNALADPKYLPKLVDSFACNPSFIGARPHSYVDSSGTYVCKCQCPVGFHFETLPRCNLKRCVQDDSPEPDCGDLESCYEVQASTLPGKTDTTCQVRSFVNAGVPLPWKKYLNSVSPSATVTVTLTIPGGSQQKARISWASIKDLKKTYAELLDEKFVFTRAGKFTVDMEVNGAIGLKTCKTEIHLTDDVRPVTDGSCPSSRLKNIRYNSNVAVEDVSSLVSELKEFKSKAIYGQCQKGTIKTSESYVGTCLSKSVPCFSVSSSVNVNLKIKPDDVTHLKEISKTISNSVPGISKEKCLDVESLLAEQSTIFKCQSAYLDLTLLGTECDSRRCYDLYGSDLYSAKVSINDATKKKTQALMDILDPGFNNADTQIYEKISGSNVGIQKRDLQTYFDTTLSATAFGLANFDGRKDLSYYRSIMRCRYQIPESPNDAAWKMWSWTAKNEVTLDQETNTIKFECWTSIGRIYNSDFALVIHPSIDLDVCPDFIQSSFYQSVTLPSASNGPSEFCNVPGSDFAELTFQFNSWVGRNTGSLHIFWDITCAARFDHGNGVVSDFTGTPAYLVENVGPKSSLPAGKTKPTTEIIKRFAVALQNSPTTRARTRVRFDCRIRFQDQTTGKFKENNCRHVMSFRDCDKPESKPVDDSDLDCADEEACYSSCGLKHKPYQYCGPHQLTYENQGNKNMIKNAGAVQCCSTGECLKYYGAQFTCQRLGPDDDLKRCEPPRSFYMLASALIESPKNLSGIIVGVLALAAVGLRKWRQNKRDSLYDDFVYQKIL